MKRALIISYHFLPMDVIASYRTKAYADHLCKHNIYPTIVTHRWERENADNTKGWKYHEASDEVLYQSTDNFDLYRLPHPKPLVSHRKTSIYKTWLAGTLEYELNSSYHTFKTFLFEHLTSHQYDFILAIFSPHYHLKLAYEIHKSFGIPYVPDFRDLWSNLVLYDKHRPSLATILKERIITYWWKKWLSKASFFTIVSQALLDKMKEITEVEGYVVKNGYEANDFTLQVAPRADLFVVCHAGNMYLRQDPGIFLSGLDIFIETHHPEDFVVKLIGLKPGKPSRKHSIGTVSSMVDEDLRRYIMFLPRISKHEAITEMQQAQLLYFPSFPHSKGTYSGKIFDYVGARRNILAAPNDYDVIDELIQRTNAGKVCSTPEEVAYFLEQKYLEWKKNGKCSYAGDEQAINHYSRESQVAIFAKLVERHLA